MGELADGWELFEADGDSSVEPKTGGPGILYVVESPQTLNKMPGSGLVTRQERKSGEGRERTLSGVGTRQGDALWLLGPRRRDLDLVAARVELCAAGRARAVEGEDLVSEEVLARGDGRRDGDGPHVPRF